MAHVMKPVKLWSIWVKTFKGLEATLYRELKEMGVKGDVVFPSINDGGVYVRRTSMDAVWKVSIGSRISERVLLEMERPRHIRNERDFVLYASELPWGDVIPFAADMKDAVSIRVKINNSQISSEKLIRKRLMESIVGRRWEHISMKGDKLADIHKRRGALPVVPEINVKYDDDICTVYVDATGDLLSRYWRVASEGSRKELHLNSIAAAFHRMLSTFDLQFDAPGVIWDPFCGDGSLLLEIYSRIVGYPSGTPRIRFPFFNFPSHSPSLFAKTLDTFKMTPLGISPKVSLIGHTMNEASLKSCLLNYEALKERSPVSTSCDEDAVSHTASPAIEFRCASFEEYHTISMLHNCVVFTNIPRDMNGMRERKLLKMYKQFGRIIASNNMWKAVYILSGRQSFKKYSGLQWQVLLRFTDGATPVELLKYNKSDQVPATT